MDVLSPSPKLVSQDASSLHDMEAAISEKQCISEPIVDGVAKDLMSTFDEFLHIQDVKSSRSSIQLADADDVSHTEDENISGGLKNNNNTLEDEKFSGELKTNQEKSSVAAYEKCLCKYTKMVSCAICMAEEDAASVDENEEIVIEFQGNDSVESSGPVESPAMLLATPLKLMSAMKGSREKEGAPPRKLTVSWASDVYDPPPTSLSHSVKGNHQRAKITYKRNGKNKQKGKSLPRGNSSNNKKQSRKVSGSSNSCFKQLDSNDRLQKKGFVNEELDDAYEDYNFGDDDYNCANSFLRKSRNRVHFSVAEAT